MVEKTFKSKLLTFREDIGGYIVYVFENLDFTNLFDRYIMCTRFPNWESPMINIDDIGFLKFREVFAGEDSWYDKMTGQYVPYAYTGIHFLDFIPLKETKELIL